MGTRIWSPCSQQSGTLIQALHSLSHLVPKNVRREGRGAKSEGSHMLCFVTIDVKYADSALVAHALLSDAYNLLVII
jgi:hypothetical protein